MLIEVKVPVLSESISDATVAVWHKQVGDYVELDENLVDLETAKVMLEVVAPHAGAIVEIKKVTGDVVGSGEVLAMIDNEAKAPVVDEPKAESPAAEPEAAPKVEEKSEVKSEEKVEA